MTRPELVAGNVHDEALEAHVHPAGWTNPEPKPRYDLVVLGGGTAGLVGAAIAAGLGGHVALAEKNLLGGDCLVTGCVPSKALIRSARAVEEIRAAASRGVEVDGEVRVDFQGVMNRMRKLRASIAPHDSAERFTELGVDVFLGAGAFTGRDTIEVGGRTLSFRRAMVATGAHPFLPPVEGLAEAGPLTSETLFALEELPPRMIVLGGGPIGSEMAQTFARLGSAVTQLEAGERILSKDDPQASEIVTAALRRDGVELKTNARAVRVARAGDLRRVTYTQDGAEHTVEAEALLVATGRRPNVNGLGLEAASVAFTEHGIDVDDRLRTSNKRIYASGDVCSKYQFTHAADAMSRIAVRNALFPGRKGRFSSTHIPWVTYTTPEVAHVGLSAADAEGRADVRSFTVGLDGLDRAILDGETEGYGRAWVDAKGKLLAVTLVGSHVGETISEVTLALQHGLGLADLSATVHPYPTQAEVLRRLGDQYMRTKLTPRAAGFLRWWLRFRRRA